MSSGLRSGTALSRQLLWIRQTPERSGLPSADRGAGAERLGLPSGVLGTPAVGRTGHCAVSGDNDAERTIRLASVFICHLPSNIIPTVLSGRLHPAREPKTLSLNAVSVEYPRFLSISLRIAD